LQADKCGHQIINVSAQGLFSKSFLLFIALRNLFFKCAVERDFLFVFEPKKAVVARSQSEIDFLTRMKGVCWVNSGKQNVTQCNVIN
jgi:hypothetical protein